MNKQILKTEDIMVVSNRLRDFPKFDNLIFKDSGQVNRLKLCNFIKIYFDYAYYLGISPFKIVRETESTEQSKIFVAKTWKPQQIICAFLQILCALRLVTEVRFAYLGDKQKQFRVNPTYYFSMTLNVLYFIQCMTTFKRFWINQKNFVKAVNFIAFETKLPVLNIKILSLWFIRILYGICSLFAISGLVAGMDFVQSINDWTPSFWYKRLVQIARYNFFVGERPNLRDKLEDFNFSSTDHVLAVFMGFEMYMRYVAGVFLDLCLLTMALTLWIVSYSFEKIVQSEYLQDMEIIHHQRILSSVKCKMKSSATNDVLKNWFNIFGQYKAIYNVSNAVNNALGSLMTWGLAQSLIYYSIHLNEVILTSDVYRRIILSFYYASFLSTAFFSADICHRVQIIKQWLEKVDDVGTIPGNEVSIVLHGLMDNTVGIQGSGRFTVTYSFLATFGSLIVTYFIICLDHEFDPTKV